jgi:chitodextrinase
MANGITYAANHGARVVNLSYEGACSSSLVLDAAKYLRSKGGVFVGAAGNSGGDNGYPASDAVTCVTATGSNDLRTSWSSFGVATDLTAPGSGIYSTAPGGGYGAVSGTSFSSPITAGVYALMFSINPALTPSQADSILFSTAKDVGDAGWDKYYGFGLVDIEKAVALASSTIGTLGIPDTTPPSVPSNLKIATITHNSISMTWGPSTDDRAMAQYSVYRNGIKIATIGNTAYTATGLSSETDYSFTVRAEDAVLNQSGDSNTVIVKTAAAPFGISTYSVPTKTATSAAVSVILTKPGTVIVKFGTSATSLSASVQSMAANTTHTLSLAGLAAGTTYYYQVSATDVSGTVTSAISSFKTQRLSGGGKRR